MRHSVRLLSIACLAGLIHLPASVGDDIVPALTIESPVSPPTWALLQRQLLKTNADACEEFYGRYFDERGFLLCVERWGGDDGPDDAIENCHRWPILHALGADDRVLRLYKQAWEGHLRQYTLAKTTEVPFARDGMYYREFPVMFDWLHHSEGLTVFCLQGLSDPDDRQLIRRMRRFAGFYLNESPQALNYDSRHRLIRSMFTGSRGPLMRPATALDWAGDPIEIEHRFELGHGERSYEEMLAHFKDYNDIVGDHPQNLLSTALALNAFMLTGENTYRNWVLEYADAWRQRMVDNGNIIPTKIGLDGKIGGAEGKWYGSVYGWAFSVEVPQTGAIAHRNTHYLGLPGFMNAYLLTGDDRFLDPWRQQIRIINAQGKTIDGKNQYPRMYGDDGWYAYSTAKYTTGIQEIAYLTQKEEDLARVPKSGWWSFLAGGNPGFPEQSLRADLGILRKKLLASRADRTTPDTRLADDPMKYNPATVTSLVQQMLGGLPTTKQGMVLHSRLRYFDPAQRRAGMPEGCAALVEKLEADSTTVTLINTDQLHSRIVTIQAGGYGEHEFTSGQLQPLVKQLPAETETASKRIGDPGQNPFEINSRSITIQLEPGSGTRLVLGTRRYVNPPTLAFPWNRPK